MIKKIISLITILTISIQAYSQVREYDETAFVFSQEKLNGTARFLSMSGAYGAVGGDLSAADINPAGMAIYNENSGAITLDVNTYSNTTDFYNLTSNSEFSDLDFAQAGGVVVFDTGTDQWSKFTLSINTTVSNNFENYISLKGNTQVSNEGYFINPDPNFDLYNNVENQKMNNATYGDNTKTTFSIASKFNKNTYFGFSIINNTIDYNQQSRVIESSKDINDNTFNASLNQNLKVYGAGFGLNFGVITIPTKNLRLGLAYQSPTWYSLTEEFKENIHISLSNAIVPQPDNKDSIFDYRLRTPGKVTGSFAYIFGKKGLISLDYSYKDYGNSRLSPSNEFENETNFNQRIKDDYTAVSSLNIGGEYRLKYVSLRGGFHYENSPYKNATGNTNLNGYSLGFGFISGEYSKLDFAFNQTNYMAKNYFLSAPQQINTASKVNKFTVTYSINF